jgi:PPOX class probable F420-dependent enzyme
VSISDKQKYASIATQKRDGSWVWTPVWFASANETYYVFSAGSAGKVKRLRNFQSIQVAPCTVSGKITGESFTAKGWLENDEKKIRRAYRALRSKYGWQMHLLDFFSKLSGNYQKRQWIGFSFTENGAGSA